MERARKGRRLLRRDEEKGGMGQKDKREGAMVWGGCEEEGEESKNEQSRAFLNGGRKESVVSA